MARCGARIGAAAFVVGLSAFGPQAVAVADNGVDSSAGHAANSGSSTSRPESSVTVRMASRGARGKVSSTADPEQSAASVSRTTAVIQAPATVAAPAVAARNHAADRLVVAARQPVIPELPSASAGRSPAPPEPAAATAATPAALVGSASTGSAPSAQTSTPEPIDGAAPIGPIETLGVRVVTAVDRMDSAIYGALDATANWLSGLPATPFTEFLQGSLLLVRRTFFDQAPTVNPVQLTGQVAGTITGTFGVDDPEADPITYSVVEAPMEGTVTVNADGTYAYTPGADFDGSDAFVIAANDTAKGRSTGNVLEPRRPAGTEAVVMVKQGAKPVVTFNFTYATYARGKADAKAVWELNPQALPGLRMAAFKLADAVNPQYAVTLNYQLGLLGGSYLANASSDQTNTQDAGFYMTVVQDKIINGTDPTGAGIDGKVNFNFDPTYKRDNVVKRAGWAYFVEPGKSDYSFDATAMHELLHSFGFLAGVSKPGCNEFVCENNVPTKNYQTNWIYFDQFLGNSGKQFAINDRTHRWDPVFDNNVTGGEKNGLYFLGDNAVKEFGGPVPLYSPAEFLPSSSATHLADYFFNGDKASDKNYVKLMNADGDVGEPILGLSNLEIAMLKDLRYRMKG